MGMFDEIRCMVPLPVKLEVDHRSHWFQTKSMGCEMDHFEIREDRKLWYEQYDIEDRSDPSAVGLAGLQGIDTRVNHRWVTMSEFIGEIVFYAFVSSIGCESGTDRNNGWIELSAYFVKGDLKHLELLDFSTG